LNSRPPAPMRRRSEPAISSSRATGRRVRTRARNDRRERPDERVAGHAVRSPAGCSGHHADAGVASRGERDAREFRASRSPPAATCDESPSTGEAPRVARGDDAGEEIERKRDHAGRPAERLIISSPTDSRHIGGGSGREAGCRLHGFRPGPA